MTTTSLVRATGVLLFVAGALILMGIITAEALYPLPYTTGANEISDLGGISPPEVVVAQPSAAIFDATMIGAGILVIAAAVTLMLGIGSLSATLLLGLLGIGALGVGIFPSPTGNPHAISALVTFVAGGLAAIVTSRETAPPFRFLAIALGAISLAALVSALVFPDVGPSAALGPGGAERWIAYPVVIWIIGFGGYLAARE
jgi:hypothetical membrane protein